MKKAWILVITFVIVLCMSMTIKAEQSLDMKEETMVAAAIVATKSSPLSLRDTPNPNGAILCEIPKGETVAVLEKGDWSKVEYNGKLGFVRDKYLKYEENTVSAMNKEGIVGLWTAPLNGSTAMLEINANGTCELTIAVVNKAIWTLDGQTLTLTKDGVPLYGTYDGKMITLDYNGMLLTFTRQHNDAEAGLENTSSSSDMQSIVGTWTIPTKSGKITLKFNKNGTCKLNAGQSNNATWKLNGQELTLKNSNGQIINGTYDGKTVTLEIYGSQLRFTR